MTLLRLVQLRSWTAFGLAALYLLAGALGLFADLSASNTVLWIALLWGGAGLIIAGLLLAQIAGWPSAVLLSVGAVTGGLLLAGTILVPIAVAALIAMSFAIARHAPKPA